MKNFKSKIIPLKKFENIFGKSGNFIWKIIKIYSFWKQKVLIRVVFNWKFSNFIWENMIIYACIYIRYTNKSEAIEVFI